jgi:probable rRNA maturation factor
MKPDDTYSIVIQLAADKTLVPKKSLLRKWARQALSKKTDSAEITIRIVEEDEMTELNSTYRQKNGSTNVLSFPFTIPAEVQLDIPILGDIVVCAEVVNREAKAQEKPQEAHFAHMIVHGVFHLLGYDHENDTDAEIMESLETEIMQSLGYPNPYEN